MQLLRGMRISSGDPSYDQPFYLLVVVAVCAFAIVGHFALNPLPRA